MVEMYRVVILLLALHTTKSFTNALSQRSETILSSNHVNHANHAAQSLSPIVRQQLHQQIQQQQQLEQLQHHVSAFQPQQQQPTQDISAQASSSGSTRYLVSTVKSVPVPLIFGKHQEFGPNLFSQPIPAQTAIVPTLPVTALTSQSSSVLQPGAGSLERLASAVHANPVLAALLISSLLGSKPGYRQVSYNSPAHEPIDPYVALLLSHYGRYISRPGVFGHGLYGYNAANNIHNTKPFGSYKIYDDSS